MYKFLYILLLLTGSGFLCQAQSTPDVEATMCIGDTATLTATVTNSDSVQWYHNGIAIPGANNDTLLFTEGGLFYLRAFVGSSKCWDQSGDFRIYIAYPKVNDDQYTMALGHAEILDVLANDEPKCAPFNRATFTIVDSPTVGKIISVVNGMVLYKPSSVRLESDKFTYRISDIDGRLSNIATAYIDIDFDCALVYPNPVEKDLNITVNNKRITAVNLYDATGRFLFRSIVNTSQMKIDMSSYAQGMYMVEFVDHDGVGCVFRVVKTK